MILFFVVCFITVGALMSMLYEIFNLNEITIEFNNNTCYKDIDDILKNIKYDNIEINTENYIAKYKYDDRIRKGRDIINSENEVLVPLMEANKLGNYISINDKEYKVVGTTNNSIYELRLESLNKNDQISKITFIDNSFTNSKIKAKYKELLKQNFNARIIESRKITFKEIYNYSDYFKAIMIILLFSFISIILGNYYIFSSRKDNYKIFHLLGISNIMILLYSNLERIIIALVQFIIGLIIYKIIQIIVLEKTYLYAFNISYELLLKDYLIIICIVTILSLIAINCNNIRIFKNNRER